MSLSMEQKNCLSCASPFQKLAIQKSTQLPERRTTSMNSKQGDKASNVSDGFGYREENELLYQFSPKLSLSQRLHLVFVALLVLLLVRSFVRSLVPVRGRTVQQIVLASWYLSKKLLILSNRKKKVIKGFIGIRQQVHIMCIDNEHKASVVWVGCAWKFRHFRDCVSCESMSRPGTGEWKPPKVYQEALLRCSL